MTLDPICCLTVDESTERRATFRGETVYFCSERCRGMFLSTPDSEKTSLINQGPANHICARHPEVWQENPCDCPKCRMVSESVKLPVGTDAPGSPMLHDMAARFQVAGSLALKTFRHFMAGLAPAPAGHSRENGRHR
jgi:Cu+-exporting ATPase